MLDFNAYWAAMHTVGLYALLAGRKMARSVTEAQSHNEGKGWQKCNSSA